MSRPRRTVRSVSSGARRAAWVAVLLGIAGSAAQPAQAALTQAQLDTVGVSQKIGSTLPVDLAFTTEDGGQTTLGRLMAGRPMVLVFADYECSMICGPALSAFARVLSQMPPAGVGRFSTVVVDLDSRDTPAVAQRARDAWFEKNRKNVRPPFVIGTAKAVDRLATITGYHLVYDSERDAFAHPVVAIFTDQNGRIVRYLPLLGMTARDMQLALNDAGTTPDGLAAAIRTLCYRYDPTIGRYSPIINNAMQVAGLGTMAVMLAGLAFLVHRQKKR